MSERIQQLNEALEGPGRPFLTARWESLVLLNFDCPREFLEPLVPGGTQLDSWHGSDVMSLVGFRFVGTRIRGIGIPWHQAAGRKHSGVSRRPSELARMESVRGELR